MFNQALVQSLLNTKLDEILSGSLPDGFKEKLRTSDRLELVAEGGDLFGIKCNFLRLAFTYRNTEIIITHE